MSAHGSRRSIARETPEEARESIASALEFLHGEAAALGMRDVSALIALASKCVREYRINGTAELPHAH